MRRRYGPALSALPRKAAPAAAPIEALLPWARGGSSSATCCGRCVFLLLNSDVPQPRPGSGRWQRKSGAEAREDVNKTNAKRTSKRKVAHRRRRQRRMRWLRLGRHLAARRFHPLTFPPIGRCIWPTGHEDTRNGLLGAPPPISLAMTNEAQRHGASLRGNAARSHATRQTSVPADRSKGGASRLRAGTSLMLRLTGSFGRTPKAKEGAVKRGTTQEGKLASFDDSPDHPIPPGASRLGDFPTKRLFRAWTPAKHGAARVARSDAADSGGPNAPGPIVADRRV